MTNYFISVVVPAYNEEKYIRSTLESLKNQSYPQDQYELIVELSGSTDQTEKIAREYNSKITNTGSKQGVSSARANGSEATRGEIIAQTDADTLVSRDWLEKINASFQDPKVVGITGSIEFDKTNWLYKFLAKFGFPLFVRTLHLFGKKIFTGMNFAIRRETYFQIGGFRKELASSEDSDLGIRAGKVGKVVFVPDLVVYTSARRIEKSPFGFFKHHALNAFGFLAFDKARKFENIR